MLVSCLVSNVASAVAPSPQIKNESWEVRKTSDTCWNPPTKLDRWRSAKLPSRIKGDRGVVLKVEVWYHPKRAWGC
eukprot:scaffold1513_cov100-Amphora_coffeaeformis.AAC.16